MPTDERGETGKKPESIYNRRVHAASDTETYLFNQLIPYIGNKRKLLDLIEEALRLTGEKKGVFLDLFAGSGVVSRYAKRRGFCVFANDWEPYAESLNRAAIEANAPPSFASKSYVEVLSALNLVPDYAGWVTDHLCPDNDEAFDSASERLFYTRANGLRIDAIRDEIARLEPSLTPLQKASLLAPLLYQACYTSNTSGVFKGFHNGWGGKTGTALYRIKSALALKPCLFFDNGLQNRVFREDALSLAERLSEDVSIAYLDPPYNQHPYGANYHVLNTITLNDKPVLSKKIEGRNKAAIRLDWRRERHSAYNYRAEALQAYQALLQTLRARWILTSYSTDGTIPLAELVGVNVRLGATQVVLRGYKRYRVSSQRFSKKPMNIEFVLVLQKGARGGLSEKEILTRLDEAEKSVLLAHGEMR